MVSDLSQAATSTPESTDPVFELSARQVSGGELSVGRLYRLGAARLERLASRITDDAVAAQDAVHETFLDLLRQPQRLANARAVWPLLIAMTTNKARRICRGRRRRRQHHGDLDEFVGRPLELETLDRSTWVRQRVARLPQPFQELIALRYHDGHTDREIAARVGVPVSTVKSRLHAARAALRVMLARDQLG